MKVLHINCNYIGSTLHQLMVENLNQYGIESDVFVPTYNKDIAVIKPNDNVNVLECFNKYDRAFFKYKQKKIIEAIEKSYDLSKYDVIHAYTLFTDGNVARTLSEKYNIPYVVAVRNTDLNVFFKYMIHLRKVGINVLVQADAVFFLSKTYQKTLFTKYVTDALRKKIAHKCYIIPNGIDNFWFQNLYNDDRISSIKRVNDKKLRVIYVGRIDRNKNVKLTLEALEHLKKMGWEILYSIIGEVKDQKIFTRICESDIVCYYPPMSKERLVNFYREADLFVMPSHTETFGLVYAEAMSQGLPILYTKGQGFDEQFNEGDVGYHVSDSDSNDLVNKIMICTEYYKEISQKTIKLTHKFKWSNICESYFQIYKKIININ